MHPLLGVSVDREAACGPCPSRLSPRVEVASVGVGYVEGELRGADGWVRTAGKPLHSSAKSRRGWEAFTSNTSVG